MDRETENLNFQSGGFNANFLTPYCFRGFFGNLVHYPHTQSFLTRPDVLHVAVNLFPFHFLEIGAVPLASPFLSSVHASRAVFA